MAKAWGAALAMDWPRAQEESGSQDRNFILRHSSEAARRNKGSFLPVAPIASQPPNENHVSDFLALEHVHPEHRRLGDRDDK